MKWTTRSTVNGNKTYHSDRECSALDHNGSARVVPVTGVEDDPEWSECSICAGECEQGEKRQTCPRCGERVYLNTHIRGCEA
jgi:hypothetical protein